MNSLMNVNELTMSSLEMSELTETRHDNVKRTIETLVLRGVISQPQIEDGEKSANGTIVKLYKVVKRDSFVVVAQLSPEFTGRVVDRWIELEGLVKQSEPKTALQLAKEQVLLLEALEETQRNLQLAIKTKAEIGTRREATAMNTASQAVKRVNALEVELDLSKSYSTIKRMEMLHYGVKFKWQLLKSTSIEMGIKPIDVFDQNYGTVKAYHKDVWKETYALNVD
jgi:phage regulator Rha-like protein